MAVFWPKRKNLVPTPANSVFSKGTFDTLKYIEVTLDSWTQSISSDADLGFGQKVFDMREEVYIPVAFYVDIDLDLTTGLVLAVGSDDGELAFGSVVASGAVDELGGTATFEDHVAAPKALTAIADGETGPERHFIKGSLTPFDGTATPKDIYLNIAATWDQTGSDSVTITGKVGMWYFGLGDFVA